MFIRKLIARALRGRAILCLCLAVLFAATTVCFWTPARSAQAIPIIPNIFSNDANLSNLALSTGGIIPAFAPGTTSYKAISNSSKTQVNPLANESNATITVNGAPVTSGNWSSLIPLNVGDNTVTVKVTAQDGTTTKTYSVVVKRNAPAVSSDANLSDLWISSGGITPAFAPGTTSYTAFSNNPVTTVKPFANESNATITVNGAPVISGNWSPGIPLNVGDNTVTVKVTAQDGTTTKTYTIVVKRNAPAVSSDANLSDLITNSGQLTPVFAPGTNSYTQTYTGPNVLVKPTAEESNATITVNGTAVASGQWSQAITLNPGQNTITVVVTAQDGTTTKTYTVAVNSTAPAVSSDANLKNLFLSSGILTPAFAPGTTSYNSISNIPGTKVAPFANESNATITVNGAPVTSGNPSPLIPLNVGDNTVTVKVTAQDGTTTKTYTVVVTRQPAAPPAVLEAPTSLKAVAASSSAINLSWTDNADNETGFKIERKTGGGSYTEIGTVPTNVTTYADNGLSADSTYFFRARAYNGSGYSDYSNEAGADTPPDDSVSPPGQSGQTVMSYYIGSSDYYVNGQIISMDTAPITRESRTLLPIRYVAEPLGASINWNSAEQKVTVTMNGKTIELWIDQNKARVNGVDTPIDPNNQNVVPIVVPPGRTMLPLRFITENLGCQVDWNESLQEVKVTYPKP